MTPPEVAQQLEAPIAVVGRSRTLVAAMGWRTRREGVRLLWLPLVPFLVVSIIGTALPLLLGTGSVNGSAGFATFGHRYGASSSAIQVGLALLTTPGYVALFASIGVGLASRTMVGAEVGRGGLEALLATVFTPRSIATAFLGYAMLAGTGLWLAMTALGALDLYVTVALNNAHLSLSGAYVALALVLPLLTAWAGAGLSVMVSLLFPRMTQVGQGGLGGGSNVGSGVALLPALGAFLALLLGGSALGVGPLLLYAGAATILTTVVSVLLVTHFFRPEKVLES